MKTSFDTYDPLPVGARRYRKKTTIRAVQLDRPFSVKTMEGVMEGKAGDWLAKGVDGELYIIAEGIFKKTYERV